MRWIFIFSILLVSFMTAWAQVPIFSIADGRVVVDDSFVEDNYLDVSALSYTMVVEPMTVDVGRAKWKVRAGRFDGWDDEPGDFDVVEASVDGAEKFILTADDGIARIAPEKDGYYSSLFADRSPNGHFIEVALTEKSKALVFLGQHYGADISRLFIVVLTERDARLVYNLRMDIQAIDMAAGNFSMLLKSEIEEWNEETNTPWEESPTHTIYRDNGILYFTDN